ncbi:MAG: serine/threonine-protein phosphatase, partial [Acidobacteria bacterium]|nr:serine/threonine-protein phosphatase [Acidobacteriota bacterium]
MQSINENSINVTSLQDQFIQLEKTIYLKYKFALIVAIFNHYPLRDKLIRKINRIFKNSMNIELTPESYPNFETFEEVLALFSKTYDLIHVVNNGEGLYKETIPLFYKGLNYHREGIAKENPVTIILWMLPEDVEDFAHHAPHMWSWHGGIFDFEIPLQDHEKATSFPFIRVTQQEKEQKRINEIRDYLEAKPELDDRLKASLQKEVAQLYYVLCDYINAETYALKCLELHRRKGDVEEMHRLYLFLEGLYRDIDENIKELETKATRFSLNISSHIKNYAFNQKKFGQAEEKDIDVRKKLLEYRNEIEIAVQRRKSILPNEFPSYLSVGMLPADERSNDFYGYTVIDKNRVAFFVGDVEGKGLPAALLAVKCSSILKSLAELGKQPAECLQILNERLVDERDKNNSLPVSLFFGLLDLASGDLEYDKAGKIAFTFIIQKDGFIKKLEDVDNFPLGFFGNMTYNSGRIKLNTGDMFCTCTDGLTDTLD